MKKLLNYAFFGLFLYLLSGCSCEHEWIEATCEEPKTCEKCGETEGEALGHSWIEATCTDPKTCEECGTIEGEALGHIEGSMKYTETDYVEAIKIYEAKCERCNKVLDSKEEKLESLIKDGKFYLTPEELSDRMSNSFDEVADNTLLTQVTSNNSGDLGIAIGDKSTEETVGVFLLTKNSNDGIMYSERNNTGIHAVLGMVYDDDYLARIMLATTLTFDPSLSFDEAKDVAKLVMQKRTYTKNGVTYLISTSNGSYVIGVGID